MTISLWRDSVLMISTNDKPSSLTGRPNIITVYFRLDVVATNGLAYKNACALKSLILYMINNKKSLGTTNPHPTLSTTTMTPPTTGMAKDKFGITILYPTVTDGLEYFVNWGGGRKLTFGPQQTDPEDPAYSSQGDSTCTVNGDNTANWKGNVIRQYIDITKATNNAAGKMFENMEITYYMRTITPGLDVKGKVPRAHNLEARTDWGHPGTDVCKGIAYGCMVRVDGSIMFKKELRHPNVTDRNPSTAFSWDFSKWLGIKFILRTMHSSQNVKLQCYIDKTSAAVGGNWVLMQEYIDMGGWDVPGSTRNGFPAYNPSYPTICCNFPQASGQPTGASDMKILGPKPVNIFRDDGNGVLVEKQVGMLSIREIAPLA